MKYNPLILLDSGFHAPAREGRGFFPLSESCGHLEAKTLQRENLSS
jgi:hypothetical protein